MKTKFYAIVPAAGSSGRMGTPKLLLPWPASSDGFPTNSQNDSAEDSHLIIDRVLTAWTNSQVDATIVIVRRNDSGLLAACRRFPVEIVSPEVDPADMKGSIQAGLECVQQRYSPSDQDHFLVAPADLPLLSSALIDAVINFDAAPGQVVVPRFADKAGHPVMLPWSLAANVAALSPSEGLDVLISRSVVVGPRMAAQLRVADIDTPQEYRAALERAKERIEAP